MEVSAQGCAFSANVFMIAPLKGLQIGTSAIYQHQQPAALRVLLSNSAPLISLITTIENFIFTLQTDVSNAVLRHNSSD
jgi:hypothetical protein